MRVVKFSDFTLKMCCLDLSPCYFAHEKFCNHLNAVRSKVSLNSFHAERGVLYYYTALVLPVTLTLERLVLPRDLIVLA